MRLVLELDVADLRAAASVFTWPEWSVKKSTSTQTTLLHPARGVTPGAVSQHLAVLYRGGLVDRQRSGRTVLYQASELGFALLRAGADS
jgi:DNA-binding transcriptional ArsR family regulator